jgi:hypothetical protein
VLTIIIRSTVLRWARGIATVRLSHSHSNHLREKIYPIKLRRWNDVLQRTFPSPNPLKYKTHTQQTTQKEEKRKIRN